MRGLSLILIMLIAFFSRSTDSPHGDKLDISCSECHTSESWKVDRHNIAFNHDITKFKLTGMHQGVNCKSCHESLIFNEAETECFSCHIDLHQKSVGFDCGRCHSTNSWIVPEIIQIHRMSRFPLTGAHMVADCYQCHVSASTLNFEPLGVNCYDCHSEDYASATTPNHIEGNYSTNCVECHKMNAFTWSSSDINHSFFPLTDGHNIDNCSSCHTNGTFEGLSPQCITCHQSDYNSALSPNHNQLGFSTDCNICHTLARGWKPAKFDDHDMVFPIYSGEHRGEWNSCTDCHPDPANYSLFTCIDCHEHNKGEMDDEHQGIAGYEYSSIACLACHPTGSGEGSFDHSLTNFPLTGAHTATICSECHASGYQGTPMECVACHNVDFNESTNPSHPTLGLSTECAECHTTDPGWAPASFEVHNDYYALIGAHIEIANNCVECHEGNYQQTPNTCYECHTDDYNQAQDPNHVAAQFGTNCIECHTENSWEPATFDHDNQYFPIYSGEHNNEWNTCTECHTTPGNYTAFSCIDCHDHNQADMDDEHQGIPGYEYLSEACFACHPTGSAEGAFDHSLTNFPLTGAHNTVVCSECHISGYTGTPTNCAECHTNNYNQTTNPSHQTLGLSTECSECHTTNPGWAPATFSVHNNYYMLSGAHLTIANNCVECHNGNYNSTPNTCYDCHTNDYNSTSDPDHVAAQFSTECQSCHTEIAWTPSTFDHDNQYFPIYSGKHNGEWNTCNECHTVTGNYAIFSCIDCHEHNQNDMDDEHQGVSGYAYNSEACLSCHPDGEDKSSFRRFEKTIVR